MAGGLTYVSRCSSSVFGAGSTSWRDCISSRGPHTHRMHLGGEGQTVALPLFPRGKSCRGQQPQNVATLQPYRSFLLPWRTCGFYWSSFRCWSRLLY